MWSISSSNQRSRPTPKWPALFQPGLNHDTVNVSVVLIQYLFSAFAHANMSHYVSWLFLLFCSLWKCLSLSFPLPSQLIYSVCPLLSCKQKSLYHWSRSQWCDDLNYRNGFSFIIISFKLLNIMCFESPAMTKEALSTHKLKIW